MGHKTYISFDWALKRLLRDKANFDVLEGFISTLLERDVRIKNLLESEGNMEREESKYNRVDLLCEDEHGDLLLIEVQGESEFAFFQRILFGTSKLVSEYINRGDNYDNVKKVYSINIVYFDLGQGKDVVYHGTTEFRGIHNGDVLRLSPFQQQKFDVNEVYQLFPEYYILKVNDFNTWSKVPLEQWLYFLSTSEIPEDADAPGLQAAREKMRYMQMNRSEQRDYDKYLDDRVIFQDQMKTARGEGKLEGYGEGYGEGYDKGKEKGRAEGERQAKLDTARSMKRLGVPLQTIVQATELSEEEVNGL